MYTGGSQLTGRAVAGIAVLVPLPANAAILTGTRIAGDVLALAVVSRVALVAGTTATKNNNS